MVKTDVIKIVIFLTETHTHKWLQKSHLGLTSLQDTCKQGQWSKTAIYCWCLGLCKPFVSRLPFFWTMLCINNSSYYFPVLKKTENKILLKVFTDVDIYSHHFGVFFHHKSWLFKGLDLRINAKMCPATLSQKQPNALGEILTPVYGNVCHTGL